MFDRIGDGDTWRLTDNDIDSLCYKKSFIFDFTHIKSEKIRNVMKCYVWRNYIERTVSVKTLYGNNTHFKYFVIFAELNNISSFEYLENKDISNFISFLRTTLSVQTRKPLSYVYQKGLLDSTKGNHTLGAIIYAQ